MFGINGGELIVGLLVAAVGAGPEKLPQFAKQLATAVRKVRDVAQDAKAHVKEEMGDEAADVHLSDFDPRQLDPRYIVREALRSDTPNSSVDAGARRKVASVQSDSSLIESIRDSETPGDGASRVEPTSDGRSSVAEPPAGEQTSG